MNTTNNQNQDIDNEIKEIGDSLDQIGREIEASEADTREKVEAIEDRIAQSSKEIKNGVEKLRQIDSETENDIDSLISKQKDFLEE